MKLVTLNAWGGRVEPAFSEFIDRYKVDTDVLCFQEVFRKGDVEGRKQLEWFEIKELNPNLLEHIVSKLPDWECVFTPVVGENYGLATLVKMGVEVLASGAVLIYENDLFYTQEGADVDHTRRFQWLKIRKKGTEYVVINIHGYWTHAYKGDTPERLMQSKLLLEFIESQHLPVLLAGDFNANPDTESITMLGQALRNLVVENGVKTTRTILCPGIEKFPYADYIFVSKDLEVKDFQVLPEVASDHAGLSVEVA